MGTTNGFLIIIFEFSIEFDFKVLLTKISRISRHLTLKFVFIAPINDTNISKIKVYTQRAHNCQQNILYKNSNPVLYRNQKRRATISCTFACFECKQTQHKDCLYTSKSI